MLHNHSWSSHANSETSWEYDQLSYSLYSLCDIISVRALRLYLFLYLFLHVYHMTPIVKRTLLPWGLLVALAGNITNRGESWKKCGWCLHWLYACFYPNAPYITQSAFYRDHCKTRLLMTCMKIRFSLSSFPSIIPILEYSNASSHLLFHYCIILHLSNDCENRLVFLISQVGDESIHTFMMRISTHQTYSTHLFRIKSAPLSFPYVSYLFCSFS